MKNSLKYILGTLMIAGLTACGGGGGGGGSSDPGAAAYATAGSAGYLGVGDWNGGLIGQNIQTQQYQTFMYQFGGGSYTTIIQARIWSGQTGMLPAQMGFSLNGRTMGGDGFMSGNGFLINNYTAGYGYGAGYYPGQVQCFAYPCPQQVNPAAQGTPTIRINAQFVDACRTTMNVQIIYQNVVVASGTMTGYDNMSVQGYGYGQPYGAQPYAGIPAQCTGYGAQPYGGGYYGGYYKGQQ